MAPPVTSARDERKRSGSSRAATKVSATSTPTPGGLGRRGAHLQAEAAQDAAAPFGGAKQSGLGREGGAEGVEEYLSIQYVGIADPLVGPAA